MAIAIIAAITGGCGAAIALGIVTSLKLRKEKSFVGDFIPEKTAEEIIEDLKKSRNFNRDIESL